MPAAAPATPTAEPAGAPLGRRSVWLVALLAIVLQLVVWGRSEGYQLADEIEYLDRAEMLLDGDWRRAEEAVDLDTIRSVVFPALLVPVLWVVDVLGLPEFWNVRLASALSMLCGVLLAIVLARIAARRFGREAGLVCGVVVASNPILAQASTVPLSEALVALAITLGLGAVLDERRGARAGLRAGLWFGFAAMIAYKSFVIAAVALPAMVVRDRWRGRASWLSFGGTLAGMVLVQSLIDLAIYGRFGASVLTWIVVNALTALFRLCFELGLREPAVYLYDLVEAASGEVSEAARAERIESGQLAQRKPKGWYLTHGPGGFLAWPYVALLLAGVFRELRRPRWTLVLLPGGLLLTLYALSTKGEKSLRLLLPLLPVVALLCATGWAWVSALAFRERLRLGRLALGAVLLLGVALGTKSLLDRNLRQYAGYWRAIALVNEAAAGARAANPDRGPLVVGSAWNWAVQYRVSPDVELMKLHYPLEGWADLDRGARELLERQLHVMDGFIVHLNAVRQYPDLYAILNREFEIARVLYDRETFGELEPVAVLRARTGSPEAMTFFERREGLDPRAFLQRIEYPGVLELRDPENPTRRIWFLGVDTRELGEDGALVWITYHWLAGELPDDVEYRLIGSLFGPHRLEDEQGEAYMRFDRLPAWGAAPTSTWEPGEIVSESYLLDLPVHPGAFASYWALGDLVPTDLFVRVGVLNEAGDAILDGLMPFEAFGDPLEPDAAGRFPEPGASGWYFERYRAARFWLSVPDRTREIGERMLR